MDDGESVSEAVSSPTAGRLAASRSAVGLGLSYVAIIDSSLQRN